MLYWICILLTLKVSVIFKRGSQELVNRLVGMLLCATLWEPKTID